MLSTRHFLSSLLLLAAIATATAQTPRDDFRRNPYLAGSNYVAYPVPTESLTPAPQGYAPVYLSHYGRHGSRYHIGDVYKNAAKALAKADKAGALTAYGKDIYNKVKLLREEARGRDGELTERGAEQHRGIAHRMWEHFPELFTQPIHVDAKSTVVIRCILSMENALQELARLNPKLTISHDASAHDMWYMNQNDKKLYEQKKQCSKIVEDFQRAHIHPSRLIDTLFCSPDYVRHEVKPQRLMRDLFKLAMNLQSSELRKTVDLTSLFTADETYDLWQAQNAYWYMTYGPSRYTGGKQPFSQRNLLRRIITEADSCLALPSPGVTLRYGHDTMVLPLTCLMELDGLDQDIADLNALPMKGWCDYKIMPMACNIQLVFYRPLKGQGDTLVKVLRNEREAKLPMKAVSGPYYRWDDVKGYYLKKLDGYGK